MSKIQKRGKQASRAAKVKTKKSKEKVEDTIGDGLGDEIENLDDILAAEEKEKQLKLIDELESGGGGVVEDIDLTTDDWVNVNPSEIAKRYDMIRRYVILIFCKKKNKNNNNNF